MSMQTNPDLIQSIELNSMITSKIKGMLNVLTNGVEEKNKNDEMLKTQLLQMYSIHKIIKKKLKNI